MANPLLAINYVADAAIPINRIVKFGTGDRAVALAAGAGESLIGVVNETAAALGERVDVVRVGIAWVEASAAITRGALITSDPTGRAVTAAPGAGLNNRIIGIADESASAAGDVIRFMLAPGMLQG